MEEFRSKVKVDITPHGHKLFKNGDITHIDDTDVDWQLEFEMRKYGIKDTYISIPEQALYVSGTFAPMLENGEMAEEDEDFELEILDAEMAAGFSWQINGLCPYDLFLEYDDKSKKWFGTLR